MTMRMLSVFAVLNLPTQAGDLLQAIILQYITDLLLLQPQPLQWQCRRFSEVVTAQAWSPAQGQAKMVSQPQQPAPVHSAPAVGQLKSALLLCVTAAAAAAAAGGVAYWWLTCVAQPQSRQQRPRGRSKKSSSGTRTQSAATSGGQAAAARLQAQQQQRGDSGADSSSRQQQQQLRMPAAGGPVAALQQAARVTGGGSSSSSAAASIESPFARQRAAVAAARGIKDQSLPPLQLAPAASWAPYRSKPLAAAERS
jgi:hypothetical protein